MEMKKNISFNGKTYKNIDEMPDDIRELYTSTMKIFDSSMFSGAKKQQNDVDMDKVFSSAFQNAANMTQNVTYNSLEEVPEDLRKIIQQQLDNPGNSGNTENITFTSTTTNNTYNSVEEVPDDMRKVFEQQFANLQGANTSDNTKQEQKQGQQGQEQKREIAPSNTMNRLLLIAIFLLFLLLCLAIASLFLK